MKSFYLTIMLAMVLCVTNIAAQNNLNQTIKGKVIDLGAEYPMIGVNVILVGSDPIIATSTDINGNYKLENVPVGRQAFYFYFIGYKPITVPNVLVNSAKETILDVALEEDLKALEEAVIMAEEEKGKAENDLAGVSSRSLSMDELSRFSGSTGEIQTTFQRGFFPDVRYQILF